MTLLFYIVLLSMLKSGGVCVDDHNGEAAGEGFADGGGRGHPVGAGSALGYRLAYLRFRYG